MFTKLPLFIITALKFALVVLKTNRRECLWLSTIWGPDPLTQRRENGKRRRGVIRRELMRYVKVFEDSDLNSE